MGELATKVGSGKTPTGGNTRYRTYGLPFVRSQNVGWGTLLLTDLQYIDQETHAEFPSSEIAPGDVLLNITGASIGRSAVASEALVGGNVNQHVCIIRPRSADSRLINHFLLSPVGQRQIDSFQAGGNRQGLNFSQVGSIKIPLPPAESEQRAIADTLTNTDTLIDSLKQLLIKKRQIKQGAMQELLTGKRRLPGFEQPWINRPFGNIASLSRDRVNPSSLSIPPLCVELENLQTSTGRLVGEAFESRQVATKSVFRRGDVLFGKLRAYLRKYWLAEFDGVCSTEIWVLRPTGELSSQTYLLYTVQRDDFIEAASTAYGTHMPRSDWKIVAEFELPLPSDASEQVEIANVLSDMDAEITALESRLTKARAVKQAMAQALLTGRIRLLEPQT